MERIRSLTCAAGVGVLALIAGCTSTPPAELVPESVMKAVSMEQTEPASQIVCFWQRRLSTLPDPTRDGAQTSGIAGQMFLITPSNSAATITGDLGVVVFDETPRAAGQAAMKPEYWHYDKGTLSKLVTNDERFGKSYVLFLPWPAHWQGAVTAVRIVARYMSPGNPDLFAGEVRMELDFSSGGPVWSEVGTTTAHVPVDNRTVPNPEQMLNQARTQGLTQALPAPTPAPPSMTGTPATGGVMQPAAPNGSVPLPAPTPLPQTGVPQPLPPTAAPPTPALSSPPVLTTPVMPPPTAPVLPAPALPQDTPALPPVVVPQG